LMMAVKRFDPTKGFRLISYAVWWIRAYIQKFILETFSLVKMGTTQIQRKLFSSLSKIRARLTKLDGVEPTDEVLADALSVKTKEVTSMKQRMSAKDKSLDTPLADDNHTTHLEMLKSTSPNQEEAFASLEEDKKVSALVKPFLNQLKEKERAIVEKRLMSDEPVTLEEIGQEYDISRERVRQIEDNVKKKIKGYLTEKGFSYNPA
jgi:RNA polymerase sigma-32 factor